ncbi:hypothetical protein DIPPA_01088 [Diplonema papillatum]|nr:hypothetical protein DIPPA_01088 [Diplonema papillatum]
MGISTTDLGQAALVWKALTTACESTDHVQFTPEEILGYNDAARSVTYSSVEPDTSIGELQGLFGKLLGNRDTREPAAAANAAGEANAAQPPIQQQGYQRKTSYSDWSQKADQRRALFRDAKSRGERYNVGVMLRVSMCKGPTDGNPGFPMGRGRPVAGSYNM